MIFAKCSRRDMAKALIFVIFTTSVSERHVFTLTKKRQNSRWRSKRDSHMSKTIAAIKQCQKLLSLPIKQHFEIEKGKFFPRFLSGSTFTRGHFRKKACAVGLTGLNRVRGPNAVRTGGVSLLLPILFD